MLTEVCAWLRNHFEREVYTEKVVISGGSLTGFDDRLLNGQYFRIQGSVLNDGVHLFPSTDLSDETFDGTITSMAIPKAVVEIAKEMEEWKEKYGSVSSPAMSPFQSESFGGYSYNRGSSSKGDSSSDDMWSKYGSRLAPWRKL